MACLRHLVGELHAFADDGVKLLMAASAGDDDLAQVVNVANVVVLQALRAPAEPAGVLLLLIVVPCGENSLVAVPGVVRLLPAALAAVFPEWALGQELPPTDYTPLSPHFGDAGDTLSWRAPLQRPLHAPCDAPA